MNNSRQSFDGHQKAAGLPERTDKFTESHIPFSYPYTDLGAVLGYYSNDDEIDFSGSLCDILLLQFNTTGKYSGRAKLLRGVPIRTGVPSSAYDGEKFTVTPVGGFVGYSWEGDKPSIEVNKVTEDITALGYKHGAVVTIDYLAGNLKQPFVSGFMSSPDFLAHSLHGDGVGEETPPDLKDPIGKDAPYNFKTFNGVSSWVDKYGRLVLELPPKEGGGVPMENVAGLSVVTQKRRAFRITWDETRGPLIELGDNANYHVAVGEEVERTFLLLIAAIRADFLLLASALGMPEPPNVQALAGAGPTYLDSLYDKFMMAKGVHVKSSRGGHGDVIPDATTGHDDNGQDDDYSVDFYTKD